MGYRLALAVALIAVLALGFGVSGQTASAQVLLPVPATPQALPGGPYYGTVNVPVNFIGAVRTPYGFGITSFQWSFGDGSGAIGAMVSHTYTSAGTFPVTLTVIDPSGLASSASTTATIQSTASAFQVSAGGPYSGAVNAPLTFTGSLTGVPIGGPLQYTWSFGDGTTANGQTVVHLYTSAGTFPVTLTATTPTQSAVGQTTATITQTLQVSAGVSTSGFVGRPVPFAASATGATNPQYTWTFGDGTSASGQATTHTFLAPGAFTVTVTATDAATGQRDADSIVATISPSLTVDANGPYRGTVGTAITLSSTVNGATNPTYRWDFGDGSTGTGPSPSHVYQAAGTFTVTLSVTDSASSQSVADTASVIVTASGPVVAYASGWNLVAGPQDTPFAQADSPLYTLRPGDTAYEVVKASAGVQAGYGYWAYFSAPTSVTLSGTSTPSAAVLVPGGQFVLVGNPSATDAVSIHDATYALGWDPLTGSYKSVTSLPPGAGAWVYVASTDVVALEP